MANSETLRTLTCLEELFKEDDNGETLLGRVEDILLRAAGDGSATTAMVGYLPCENGTIVMSKEYLQFKSLEAAQDILHTLASQIDVFRNQLNISRGMLSACVENGDDNDR
jgi:hypothetical protein